MGDCPRAHKTVARPPEAQDQRLTGSTTMAFSTSSRASTLPLKGQDFVPGAPNGARGGVLARCHPETAQMSKRSRGARKPAPERPRIRSATSLGHRPRRDQALGVSVGGDCLFLGARYLRAGVTGGGLLPAARARRRTCGQTPPGPGTSPRTCTRTSQPGILKARSLYQCTIVREATNRSMVLAGALSLRRCSR